MRILLVSDIHGNWPALAALREPHDICLCMGDLVEYGPEPGKVVQWARENCAYCVRGNHDHGVAQSVDVMGVGGFRYLTMATRVPTQQMLNSADRRYLADLPTMSLFTLAGKRFLLVHATPRDPMDEYVMADPVQWANRVAGWNADYVCVGHTHVQFALDVVGTKVINPGSLGLQRDGVPLARYAVIDGDEVQLKQMEYDVEATAAAVDGSPFDDKAKKMLNEVYRYGRYQHPLPGANGIYNPVPERVGA
jgi:putative phosphoesterase